MTNQDALSVEIGRTTRAFSIVALMALSIQCGVIMWRITSRADAAVVEDKTRVLLWVVGILPAWVLAISLGLAAAKSRRTPPTLPTVVTALAMLMPVVVAVFFHDVPVQWDSLRNGAGYAMAAGTAIVILRMIFVGEPEPRAEKSPIAEIAGFALDSMWWEWAEDGAVIRTMRASAPHRIPSSGYVHLPPEEITARRNGDAYSEWKSLRAFQQRFSGVKLDGPRLARMIALGRPESEAPLRLLDIGGAEGDLTASFVAEIKKIFPHREVVVHCIETSAVSSDYKEAIIRQGVAECRLIEGVYPMAVRELGDARYDIVLASHSLYSVIDQAIGTRASLRANLMRLIDTGGVALVVLSSNRSTYWHLRAALRARLFPHEDVEDSCAESLERGAEEGSGGEAWQISATVDNVVDVSGFNAGAGADSQLALWLGYVLRKPPGLFKGPRLEDARAVISEWGIDGAQLPECFLAGARAGGVTVSDTPAVVLHKASVFILGSTVV